MTSTPLLTPLQSRQLRVFCTPETLDCFQSIVHESEIWKLDHYDVADIHAEPRERFQELLYRLRGEREGPGMIWLVKGDSGAGKTHLMRAFRHLLHDEDAGYFSYMQMTSAESNYPQYILRHTLESLDKPYTDDPTGSVSGLTRLSRALAEHPEAVPPDRLKALREDEMSSSDVIDLVFDLADRLTSLATFERIDLGLIRALLFLQRDDDKLRRRVMSYLRCEDLSQRDRQWLDMPARTAGEDPQRLLTHLALLIWALDAGVLVVCLDQLEYLYRRDDTDTAERFRNAVQAVNTLVSHCPRLLVLVSCLNDYYEPLRAQLTASEVDRLEHDPAPAELSAYLDRDAIRALIGRRLDVLYDLHSVEHSDAAPLYPFPADFAEQLQGMRLRDILNICREMREQSLQTRQPPALPGSANGAPAGPAAAAGPDAAQNAPGAGAVDEATLLHWDQRWNDVLTRAETALPDDAAEQQQLLGATLAHCSRETAPERSFRVHPGEHGFTVETLNAAQQTVVSRFVSLCDKSAVGGALARQLAQTAEAAGDKPLVVARNTPFPSNPTTKIAKQIAGLIARGMSRVVIEDSDWRAMAAMRTFVDRHSGAPGLTAWLAASKPLSVRPSLKALLGLDAPLTADDDADRTDEAIAPKAAPPAPEAGNEAPSPSVAAAIEDGQIQLGVGRDHRSVPLRLPVQQLTRHAAFLGGSGSGKTTLALNIVEQLLMQDIPALLLDRKGDLASYAKAYLEHGSASDGTASPAATLLDRIDVALYTPGSPQGRPLGIPVISPGLSQMPANERSQGATAAAMALGGMMGYKPSGQAKTRLAILSKAVDVLAELSGGMSIGLGDLIEFLAEPGTELLTAIGQLDAKHINQLVQDLETLHLMNGHLFSEQDETLSCEALFGVDAHRVTGRTRLSIVSTASLGGDANVIFWVAQLLTEIGRYAHRRPSERLQCVILFDEADLYLPANAKPATKQPLENLLRRARSAGIGLLLATQSPGDLDYKSRDQINSWFLGKIRESTALNKLKPMLSETAIDVESKLPGQTAGQFYVIAGDTVTSLQAHRSLIDAEQVPEEAILRLAARLRTQTATDS